MWICKCKPRCETLSDCHAPVEMKPELDDVCAICGAKYGEHRDIDGRCPPNEETIDHKSKWLDTKFKPRTA